MYHRSTLNKRYVNRRLDCGLKDVQYVRLCLTEEMIEAFKEDDRSKLEASISTSLSDSLLKKWTLSGLHEGEEEPVEESKEETNAISEKSTVDAIPIVNEFNDVEEIIRVIKGASFIAGMHPDQATGPLVDLALTLRIPFAVVSIVVLPFQFQ